jgi:hypothetical protein
MRNGEIVDSGSCHGQSEKSPNRQDVVTNLSGKNQPSDVQPEIQFHKVDKLESNSFFFFYFFLYL